MTKKEQLLEKIKRLRRNQVGYEALHAELSGEITKHYVSESLVSVLKHEEIADTIHFTLSELHEVEQSLIETIQNCSEEHNHPLFKKFVLRYLEEKYKDAPKEEDDDEEDKEKDKEEDEDKDDDDKGEEKDDEDSSDDDDQGGPAGKEAQKPANTDENFDEEPSSQLVKEVKIKHFNDKRTPLQGKNHSSKKHSSQILDLSEVLQEGENAVYWKAVAMKQMFSKWQLKTQLAQLNGYIQRKFSK